MLNLLSANRIRLTKSKLFWIGLCTTVGYSIFLLVMNYWEKVSFIGHSIVQINWYLLSPFPIVSVFCPLFCCTFIGTEYSDGTMRNRLIVGHSRVSIYLANFITVCLVNIGIVLISSAFTVLLGVRMFGWHLGNPVLFLLHYFGGILMLGALGGFFTMLSMLIHDKALSLTVSVVTFLACYILESMIQRLIFGYYNGEAISDMFSFLSGDRLSIPVLEWIYDVLPIGQCMQLARNIVLHPVRLPVCSTLFMGATVLLGVFLYRKQDLK